MDYFLEFVMKFSMPKMVQTTKPSIKSLNYRDSLQVIQNKVEQHKSNVESINIILYISCDHDQYLFTQKIISRQISIENHHQPQPTTKTKTKYNNVTNFVVHIIIKILSHSVIYR